jgi:hypothetical protein
MHYHSPCDLKGVPTDHEVITGGTKVPVVHLSAYRSNRETRMVWGIHNQSTEQVNRRASRLSTEEQCVIADALNNLNQTTRRSWNKQRQNESSSVDELIVAFWKGFVVARYKSINVWKTKRLGVKHHQANSRRR